ncbi:hypothetical protein [Actinoplanes sp. GCM10030250]|uniref:hypothetical protein n=1 Tax=Actinoplanes sp. GCM10030250 TaxID=3273376 RepID=UPI0036190D76
MITRLGALAERITTRYYGWERRAAGRFKTWSVRRRWLTFVLLPLMVAGCCGGVVGVPALVFLQATVDAGKGSASPEAAANEYLLTISYDTDEGLLPLLDDEHQEELLEQRAGYLSAMKATDPPPVRISWSGYEVRRLTEKHAEVNTDVRGNWSFTSKTGRLQRYNSEAHPWLITAVEDDGWRVTAVEPHPWCGGYVASDRCSPVGQ